MWLRHSSKFKVRRPGWRLCRRTACESLCLLCPFVPSAIVPCVLCVPPSSPLRRTNTSITCSARRALKGRRFTAGGERSVALGSLGRRQPVPSSARPAKRLRHPKLISARWRSTEMCPFRAACKTPATRGKSHAVLFSASFPSTLCSGAYTCVFCGLLFF